MLRLSTRRIIFVFTVFLTVFSSSSWAEKDNRQVIVLDGAARAFLVHEMRQNVSGLQQALIALSNEDMKGVATALRPLGMQGMGSVPPSLMAAVPDGFRKIGMPTHMAFDGIADAAERGAGTKEILSSIGKAMEHCVACHAAYRVESK